MTWRQWLPVQTIIKLWVRPEGQKQPIAGRDFYLIWPMRSLSWWKITGTWFHNSSGLYIYADTENVLLLTPKSSKCFQHAAKKCTYQHRPESVVLHINISWYRIVQMSTNDHQSDLFIKYTHTYSWRNLWLVRNLILASLLFMFKR